MRQTKMRIIMRIIIMMRMMMNQVMVPIFVSGPSPAVKRCSSTEGVLAFSPLYATTRT